MKKLILIFLVISSFGKISKAQLTDKYWVMVGGELVHGSYTGISPQVSDDRYKLLNLATFRIESIGAKRGNFYFDFTGLGLWMGAILGNDYLASTYTENGFHRFENNYIMRINSFRVRGDENSKGFRFGWGYQLDWRKFGVAKNEDNNGQSAFSGKGLSYGPLELKGRFSGGLNANLVKQSSWLYSRYSLNLAYSPGKIQGISVFPEAIWYVNFKKVALFLNAAYRIDYMYGNRMIIDFTNIPDRNTSIAKATHYQIGIAIDMWN